MIFFATYDPSTGRIIRSGRCDRAHIGKQGEHVLLSATAIRAKDFWVSFDGEGVASLMPKMPLDLVPTKLSIIADGSDFSRLEPVPEGLLVDVHGVGVRVMDGILDLATEMPGIYRVSVLDPRYVNQEWRIEAV